MLRRCTSQVHFKNAVWNITVRKNTRGSEKSDESGDSCKLCYFKEYVDSDGSPDSIVLRNSGDYSNSGESTDTGDSGGSGKFGDSDYFWKLGDSGISKESGGFSDCSQSDRSDDLSASGDSGDLIASSDSGESGDS